MNGYETYVSGLRGDNDIGEAWTDQFTEGEPSYSAGLRFELPLYNRAAKARRQRRQIELRQLLSQLRVTVEELFAEVEIATREVSTSYDEMQSRYQAMVANEIDLNYLQQRWRIVPGDDRAASFLLEDILDAQDRVAAEELNFVQGQVNYTMALVSFKRTLGILLQAEQVGACRQRTHCGDRYQFNKPQLSKPQLTPFSVSDASGVHEPDADEPEIVVLAHSEPADDAVEDRPLEDAAPEPADIFEAAIPSEPLPIPPDWVVPDDSGTVSKMSDPEPCHRTKTR